MSYAIKPLSYDPSRARGISERLIVSHYENNYCGAVKCLNFIVEQLAGLDPANAPGYLLNGLKREELVATNSMILHELFFDGLGEPGEPGAALREALACDFGSYERWRAEFVAMGEALGGGSGWVLLAWSPRDHRLVNRPITATRSPAARRSSRSTCTSIPITWISATRPRARSRRSWTSCSGKMSSGCSAI